MHTKTTKRKKKLSAGKVLQVLTYLHNVSTLKFLHRLHKLQLMLFFRKKGNLQGWCSSSLLKVAHTHK